MSSLTAMFVFEDEHMETEQLSRVWERFDDLSAGGEWTDHLHDPTKSGYVVGDGPYDRNVRVGKDMIVGELYADGVNERTLGVPDLPHIELRIEEALFERADNEDDRIAHAEALVDILREVYFALRPRPKTVYSMPESMRLAIEESIIETPVDSQSFQENQVNYLVWITVFTPNLVNTYGRETLLSSPAWQTYEWENGTVILVSSPDPLVQSNLDTLHDYLGIAAPW